MSSKARRMAGSQSFTVVTSTGGSKTATFTNSFPAGIYTIESISGDSDLEIYLGSADGLNVGYVTGGAKAITASAPFKYVTTANANSSDAIVFSLYTPSANATSLATKTDAYWAPPTITAVSPASLFNIDSTTTITGTNFASDAAVQFRKSDDATLVSAKQIVVGSSTSIIATRPDSFSPTDSPYDVIVTNATTGLSGSSLNAITAGSAPVWSTSATLPAFQKTVAYSQAVVATDADTSPTVTYSQVSATLPTGITFSNGTFSGTPSANGGSYNAVIRATDLGGNYADRTFTLTQDKPDAPGIGVATATAATTATIAFTAPTYTGTSTITTYTATSSPAGGTGTLSQAGSGTINITGLTAETAYTFTVTATNSSGTSLASSASSSITTPVNGATINYLVVAGGGGGGNGLGSSYYASAGGGGGGFRTSAGTSGMNSTAESTLLFLPSTVYTIEVGGGGTYATRGGNSYISGSGITTITSTGGGGGVPATGGDSSGGSGGGGGDAVGVGTPAPGAGTFNQGYAGGTPTGGRGYSGGGGGAGSTGNVGNGGNGIQSSISGSTLYYAGGGGGVNGEGNGAGSAGLGGGANGSNYGTGSNASANTGGGGGGSGYPNNSGFNQRGSSGGSGIVIIRSSAIASSTSGSPVYSNPSTGVHIYKFNSTGTITI